MQGLEVIFYIVILIMSVVIHEVAHGYAALRFGDKTALWAGRLTLNPLKHLEWFGSLILPLLLYSVGFIPFGWAKPVPYNPNNLKPRKKGTLWVAMAGIVANLSIVVILSAVIRTLSSFGSLSEPILFILGITILLNLALALFNIIPIPPLDGSKVLFELLPYKWHGVEVFLKKHSLVVFVLFIFLGFRYFLAPIITLAFGLATGIPLGEFMAMISFV
jgi:Zn-dependent protease